MAIDIEALWAARKAGARRWAQSATIRGSVTLSIADKTVEPLAVEPPRRGEKRAKPTADEP